MDIESKNINPIQDAGTGEFTAEELAFLNRLQTVPPGVNHERFVQKSRAFMENLMATPTILN